jgi:hypothetical protein
VCFYFAKMSGEDYYGADWSVDMIEASMTQWGCCCIVWGFADVFVDESKGAITSGMRAGWPSFSLRSLAAIWPC